MTPFPGLIEIEPQQTDRYRPDVEGLRALAVLLVVAFHLDVAQISGGYVGVDVFFVISGYVVTRTLWPKIQAQEFRLGGFYLNRFWRLQPSFFLVALVTLLASWIVTLPGALWSTAQSAAAAAALSANFFFWATTGGYESAAAEESPFLQMWSLAVEEQFYLLWPCLLLLMARYRPLRHWTVLGALLVGCVALSQWLAQTDASTAYYLLPSRLFELGLGAALVGFEARPFPNRWAGIAAGLGIMLIVASSVLLDRGSPFPGLNALIPCFGTALVIQAGSVPHALRGLFTNSAARSLGRVSYAWYLWHWPGIALAHYAAVELTLVPQLLLGAGSLGAAYLSYHFWETPTRRAPSRTWRIITASSAAMLAATIGTILLTHEGPLALSADAANGPVDYRHLDCLSEAQNFSQIDACGGIKSPRKKRLLIWGDSHARPYRGLVAHYPNKLGWTATTIDLGGCPPVIGVHRKDPGDNAKYCQGQIAGKVDELLSHHHFDAVLLVARYPMYEHGWIRKGRLSPETHFLSDAETTATDAATSAQVLHRHLPDTVRYLSEKHRIPVIFALPTPIMPRTPEADRARNMGVRRAKYEESRQMLEKTLESFPRDIIVLDPIDYVCDEKKCPGWADGKALYIDDNHLSARGARRLFPAIRDALKAAEAAR